MTTTWYDDVGWQCGMTTMVNNVQAAVADCLRFLTFTLIASRHLIWEDGGFGEECSGCYCAKVCWSVSINYFRPFTFSLFLSRLHTDFALLFPMSPPCITHFGKVLFFLSNFLYLFLAPYLWQRQQTMNYDENFSNPFVSFTFFDQKKLDHHHFDERPPLSPPTPGMTRRGSTCLRDTSWALEPRVRSFLFFSSLFHC